MRRHAGRAITAVAVLLAGLAVAPGAAQFRAGSRNFAHPPAAAAAQVRAVPRTDLPRASRSFARPPLTSHALHALHSARLLAASQLAAASRSGGAVPAVWARVAACEASGDWRAATGNGFYGALQFKIGTWRSHGGRGWPQDATPAEQVRVARRVLADQGVGAWPVCGPRAGLKRGD